MSLSAMSGILGHFVNTLTINDKYSLPNSENFPQLIQMQLSKKQIIFFQIFSSFLISISILKHFEKRHNARSLCISKYTDCKKSG